MKINYLSKSDIIYTNKRTIDTHGGNFNPPHNFLHEENLDYLVDIVQSEMFDQPLYPTIEEKASVYCYNIVCNHVFSDGNKRTGLEAALLFLHFNGFRLNPNINNFDITNFILKVASGEHTLETCTAWFVEHTVKK